MKYLIITTLLVLVLGLQAQNQVTIYNDNFSLVRTSLNLKLEKGLQNYFLDDIPKTIEANSVIINSKNKLEIFSQNYEYDLANTHRILQKYINENIEIVTKQENKFFGKLQFIDIDIAGIIEDTSQKLILVNTAEMQNINLEKLPDNFFLKPTLHWKLKSEKSGIFPIDFSYICSGMKWDVTYNAVWNEEKQNLELNSWVTINNNTGKAFNDIKLKLIAGDVQKISSKYREIYDDSAMLFSAKGIPSFEEKSFHDFHLYTLSENVSINNKQTKQLRLFPTSNVKAKSEYEYDTGSEKVKSIIKFENSKKIGLGVPLPKGVVKIYKKDDADNQLEFIGEDRLDHTATDEEVSLTTGYAFDIVAETKTLNVRKLGNRSREIDMSVTLKNRANKNKNITVFHYISGDWQIYKENIPFEKIDAHKIKFVKKLKVGDEFTFTWTQKVEN